MIIIGEGGCSCSSSPGLTGWTEVRYDVNCTEHHDHFPTLTTRSTS